MSHATPGSEPHVVVVGGGITGAFAADWLARLGASAIIVDPDEQGAKASTCNPGGLNPLHGPGIPGPMQPLALTSFALHLQEWESIRSLSGGDFGGRRATRVALALDSDDLERLRHMSEQHVRTPGFRSEWLTDKELLSIEPRLSRAIVAGVRLEGDARVDAERYRAAVLRAAIGLGASFVRERVRGIERMGDRVTAVRLESRSIECDATIIATGPWTSEPGCWLGVRLPVKPVKGELLLVAPSGGPVEADFVWREAAVYGHRAGRAWLGGTEECVGFDVQPSAGARATILRSVGRMWPGLGRASILRHVAALRPVSADGRPIVGRCPGWQNAYVALGSGRKGMLLSAGIGRAVAELAATGVSGVPMSACSAERIGSTMTAKTSR
jgi:glycine oxidase